MLFDGINYHIQARVLLAGTRLYEIVLIGPDADSSPSEDRAFLESLRAIAEETPRSKKPDGPK